MLYRSIFILCSGLILSACTTKSAPPSNVLYAGKGMLCTAKNNKTGRAFTAWARDEFTSRAYALSRCQSRGRGGQYCKIKACVNTAASTEVASSRWYTCYVTNPKQKGLWTSTSHNRLTSVKTASLRCERYSKNPMLCKLSYCRLW